MEELQGDVVIDSVRQKQEAYRALVPEDYELCTSIRFEDGEKVVFPTDAIESINSSEPGMAEMTLKYPLTEKHGKVLKLSIAAVIALGGALAVRQIHRHKTAS